jgi:hypothetical protein
MLGEDKEEKRRGGEEESRNLYISGLCIIPFSNCKRFLWGR